MSAKIACITCTWQPTCISTGLECFFSGSTIRTNFLWLRNRKPRSRRLLFQPGSADSTEEAAAGRSGEMLNVFQHYIQRRRTDKPQRDECVCVLMAHNVDAHTCLCVLAKFALFAGLSQVRHATRGEKEVVRGEVCTLAIRPVVSSCLTETSVFVKCCVTMSFPKCHLKKEVDRARREQLQYEARWSGHSPAALHHRCSPQIYLLSVCEALTHTPSPLRLSRLHELIDILYKCTQSHTQHTHKCASIPSAEL